MPPSDCFISARETLLDTDSTDDPPSPSTNPSYPSLTVLDRPYFPTFKIDPTLPSTITLAASLVLYHPSPPPPSLPLTVTPISGGITNALFRISNFPPPHPPSVLLRVFGAEGMIDRDEETTAYARLCDAGIGGVYIGRLGNGRVEGWLEGYRTLEVRELGEEVTSRGIAERVRRLHRDFGGEGEPGMWGQLFGWLEQAEGFVDSKKFKVAEDGVVAQRLIREDFNVGDELRHLKEDVIPKDARVSFCHNDLLAANIMVKGDTIQLIDFEYGGVNYSAFDIANHFNEFAGGTDDGKPNYELFPSEEQQRRFIEVYLGGEVEGLEEFWEEVKAFVKVNHLYWGLWAVNQAAMEGCMDFDYLLYAENRFKRYRET